jgi:hypothetical protein
MRVTLSERDKKRLSLSAFPNWLLRRAYRFEEGGLFSVAAERGPLMTRSSPAESRAQIWALDESTQFWKTALPCLISKNSPRKRDSKRAMEAKRKNRRPPGDRSPKDHSSVVRSQQWATACPRSKRTFVEFAATFRRLSRLKRRSSSRPLHRPARCRCECP